MSSLPSHQDMPRKGGFPAIPFKRNTPQRGPSGVVMLLGGAALWAYGIYSLSQRNKLGQVDYIEKRNARIALVPFLTAEEDRRQIASRAGVTRRVMAIMEGEEGWEEGGAKWSVFNNKTLDEKWPVVSAGYADAGLPEQDY